MSVAVPLQAASDTPKHSSLFVGGKLLQRRLVIGASNEPLEKEADQVAEQVMAMPEHFAIGSAGPNIQRLSGHLPGSLEIAPDSVDQVLASTGRPLEPVMRQDMERRFGHDFSQVRVHSGAIAERSARDVNAIAYTVGSNIVFGTSNYTPGTNEGRQLIAHELAHVVQQRTYSQYSGISRSGVLQRQQVPQTASHFVYVNVGDPELNTTGGTHVADMQGMKTRLMTITDSGGWTLVIAIHGEQDFVATTTSVLVSARTSRGQAAPLPRGAYEAADFATMFSNDSSWVDWRAKYAPTYVVLYGCQVNLSLERTILSSILRPTSKQKAQGLGPGCRPHTEQNSVKWTIPGATKPRPITTRIEYSQLSEPDKQGLKKVLDEQNQAWGYSGGPPVADVLAAYFDFPPPGEWVTMKVSVEDPDGPDQCGNHKCRILEVPFYKRDQYTEFNVACNRRGTAIGGRTGLTHIPGSPTTRPSPSPSQ